MGVNMSKSHQFLEGRRHAISVLESVEGLPKAMYDNRGPVQTALDNLREAAKRYPKEYAAGVMSVVDAFE
jgi:hypothetical protein